MCNCVAVHSSSVYLLCKLSSRCDGQQYGTISHFSQRRLCTIQLHLLYCSQIGIHIPVEHMSPTHQGFCLPKESSDDESADRLRALQDCCRNYLRTLGLATVAEAVRGATVASTRKDFPALHHVNFATAHDLSSWDTLLAWAQSNAGSVGAALCLPPGLLSQTSSLTDRMHMLAGVSTSILMDASNMLSGISGDDSETTSAWSVDEVAMRTILQTHAAAQLDTTSAHDALNSQKHATLLQTRPSQALPFHGDSSVGYQGHFQAQPPPRDDQAQHGLYAAPQPHQLQRVCSYSGVNMSPAHFGQTPSTPSTQRGWREGPPSHTSMAPGAPPRLHSLDRSASVTNPSISEYDMHSLSLSAYSAPPRSGSFGYGFAPQQRGDPHAQHGGAYYATQWHQAPPTDTMGAPAHAFVSAGPVKPPLVSALGGQKRQRMEGRPLQDQGPLKAQTQTPQSSPTGGSAEREKLQQVFYTETPPGGAPVFDKGAPGHPTSSLEQAWETVPGMAAFTARLHAGAPRVKTGIVPVHPPPQDKRGGGLAQLPAGQTVAHSARQSSGSAPPLEGVKEGRFPDLQDARSDSHSSGYGRDKSLDTAQSFGFKSLASQHSSRSLGPVRPGRGGQQYSTAPVRLQAASSAGGGSWSGGGGYAAFAGNAAPHYTQAFPREGGVPWKIEGGSEAVDVYIAHASAGARAHLSEGGWPTLAGTRLHRPAGSAINAAGLTSSGGSMHSMGSNFNRSNFTL